MWVLDLFQPGVLLPWIAGMLFGIFVGATPGLTATMAVALLVPMSFYLPDPNAGLALVIGVGFTAIFAGDIPATYLRIPGTPASATATLDGYEMARKGRAGDALVLDLLCSASGGVIGVLLLIFIAPQLAQFALQFSNHEYFWLAVLGLSMSAVVSRGSTLKGLVAAALGILLSTIGIDIVSGSQRFTFGEIELMQGLGFIPIMIGLFGLSEVLRNVGVGHHAGNIVVSATTNFKSFIHALKTMWRLKRIHVQSSVTGTLVGALPGAGADIAAWAAYGLARKTSANGAEFGHGCEEGVVAPTSANNAAVGGAWIPALVFGIPGDAVTAIILGALLIYDIQPGPHVFDNNPEQIRSIFAIALITQALLIPCGWLGIRLFGKMMALSRGVLYTIVVIFSILGAYAVRNSFFDIYIMIFFGMIGWYLENAKVPLAPLILGLILGPMVEENFRTALIKSSGSFLPFFTRPLSACLFLLFLAGAFFPYLKKIIFKKYSNKDLEGE